MPCRNDSLALSVGGWAPWSCAGARDPDFEEADRQTHRVLLTDERLLACFRWRFPDHRGADYDEMVRWLGWVWDCPRDGSSNVAGYCCAHCGRTRAAALDAPARRGRTPR